MKKILWSLAAVTLLSGCYEDEGNYDYSLDSMNEIKSISFVPEAIQGMKGYTVELQQPLNEAQRVKRIEVKLDQTLATDIENIDFKWIVKYKNEEQKDVADTLDTKGYLDVTLPMGKQAEFDVMLEVKDRTTSLARYSRFLVQTRPIYKNSLYILHGTEGSRKLGNIGTIGKETNVYTDAYAVVEPQKENPFTKATALSHTAFLNLEGRNNYEVDLMSVFQSDGTAVGYNPFGLSFKYPNQFMMENEVKSFQYARDIEAGDPSNYSYYRCVLSKDGRFLLGNSIPRLYIPGKGAENDGNELHQTDYQVTAATITESRYVLWDAKNERFLYVTKNGLPQSIEHAQQPYCIHYDPVQDAHVDFSNLSEATTPKGKRAVFAYIQYRENYDAAHPYFIFKDEKNDRFYRYELTSLSNGDKKSRGGDDEEDKDPVFAITSVQQMKNFNPGANFNNIIYNSWFTTNYLFYANEGNVYKYNIANGDKTVMYTAPVGYTVSTMKFRTYDSSNFSGDLGRYLSIGLVKGNEGAVAEIKLTTAADIDSEFKPTFYDKDDEGQKFGPIVDLQFAHEYMYYKELD